MKNKKGFDWIVKNQNDLITATELVTRINTYEEIIEAAEEKLRDAKQEYLDFLEGQQMRGE